MRAPFRAVEDPEWQKLALMQNPTRPLPSATTIRNKLKVNLKVVQAKMLSYYPPERKIALSLDCWSSSTRRSYLGIMAHYIDDDWILHEELIGFESLFECHSGAELAKILNNLLKTLGMEKRVISITTDNGSNNGTLIHEVNVWLEDAFDKHLFLDGNIQHIPCLSHVLQLGLKALLGQIRLSPKNEVFVRTYKEDLELNDLEKIAKDEERGLPWMLAKVSSQFPDLLLIFILIFFSSYESLQCWSILVASGNMRLLLRFNSLLMMNRTI